MVREQKEAVEEDPEAEVWAAETRVETLSPCSNSESSAAECAPSVSSPSPVSRRRGSLQLVLERGGITDELSGRAVENNERVARMLPELKAIWYSGDTLPQSPIEGSETKNKHGMARNRRITMVKMCGSLMHALKEGDKGPAHAASQWAFAWRLKHDDNLSDFARILAPEIKRLQTLAKFGLVARVFLGLLVTYVDFVSDLLLALEYFHQDRMWLCALTLGFPVALLLVHFFIAVFVDKAPPLEWVLALLGLKPIIDVYRMLSGHKRRDGAKVSVRISYSFCRAAEVCVESLPQAMTQCIVMLTSDSLTSLQFINLASSFISSGFIVANCDLDLDSEPRSRRIEPKLHGWMGIGRRKYILLVLLTATLTCACTAKIMAWATLFVYTQPLILATWLIAEFALWSAVRTLVFGAYTFYIRQSGGMPAVFSHLFGVFMFFAMHACPSPIGRNPLYTTVSPRFYLTCCALAVVDNYVILLATGAPDLAWTTVTAATCAMFTLLAFVAKFGNPAYRWMWYAHYTVYDHFREHAWAKKISFTYGPTLDDHRARIVETWNPKYWDEAIVCAWLENNWQQWTYSKPVWFTEKWQQKIPKCMLPEGVVIKRSSSRRAAFVNSFTSTFKITSSSSSMRVTTTCTIEPAQS